MDFVSGRLQDGTRFRSLTIVDVYTREAVAIEAEQGLRGDDIVRTLNRVKLERGVPKVLFCDNGPEFVAKDLRKWLADTGAKTLYIEPGSPWENGYCESFNSKLREEFLNPEIFYSIKELRVLAKRWRVHYNTVRPHSSLGYRPPAPEAWLTDNKGHAEVETTMGVALLDCRIPQGLS
jgi:putative transposase